MPDHADEERTHLWTLEAYIAHNEQRLRDLMRFYDERDRRYHEVVAEHARREKDKEALQKEAQRVKEQAERDALSLASDTQKYKDEKANELRSQIERERGSYATRDDLFAAVSKIESENRATIERFDTALRPIHDFVSTQQGRRSGIGTSTGVLVGAIATVGTLLGIIIVVANMLTGQG